MVSNAAFGLYDAPLYSLALIASRLRLVWIATVCGKIELQPSAIPIRLGGTLSRYQSSQKKVKPISRCARTSCWLGSTTSPRPSRAPI
ncbi:MAG: type IIL restriction-modification enzyme MmeI [Burkholderiales bacterium]